MIRIMLRNKIVQSCRAHFDTNNWQKQKLSPKLQIQMADIEIRLTNSKKESTNSRILAELNFGQVYLILTITD